MNDTLGAEGPVPSALVFGEFLKVVTRSETSQSRLTFADRSKIARAARVEMEKLMFKKRVARALKHAVSSASDRLYHPGHHVVLWRDLQVHNCIREWVAPFSVEFSDESKKLVYVKDVKIGNSRPFNLAQVKPYYPPEDIAYAFVESLRHFFRDYGNSQDDVGSVYLTEIVDKEDPRSKTFEMTAAKRAEIAGLLARGT